MLRGVCDKELDITGSISAHIIDKSNPTMTIIQLAWLDIIGLIGMLIGEAISILHKVEKRNALIKFFITQVDGGIQGIADEIEPAVTRHIFLKKFFFLFHPHIIG